MVSKSKFFSENTLAMEMKIGLSILEISKIAMIKSWYDYVKPKSGETAKLCYMDTDGFIFYIEIEDIYIGIGKVVKRLLDISNYELEKR